MNPMISIPLPQVWLGGEGRVRGQRLSSPLRLASARRFPLTPTLSPIACDGGEGVSQEAA